MSRAWSSGVLLAAFDGLLAYSRIGRIHPSVEDVDIAKMVRDAAEMLSPPPGFVIACEGTMAMIYTHLVSIQVVLQNLIGNALKHHDRSEGRILAIVKKKVLAHGGQIWIESAPPVRGSTFAFTWKEAAR